MRLGQTLGSQLTDRQPLLAWVKGDGYATVTVAVLLCLSRIHDNVDAAVRTDIDMHMHSRRCIEEVVAVVGAVDVCAGLRCGQVGG